MKAIILAAGRGSRMKTLTEDQPKCLVKVRGKTLLEWQLDALRAAGIDEIGIVTGYKRELLANRGLQEFYNSRWAETNMVSSLACAEEWLVSGACIVSYSDIFYVSEGVRSLMISDAAIGITYDPNWLALWSSRFDDPLSDAETFQLSARGHLLEIGSKPKTVDEVQGQYMGLLRFAPKGWEEVKRIRSELTPEICDSSHMTGTLQRVIAAGRIPVMAIAYQGSWGEVDSADDLEFYHS